MGLVNEKSRIGVMASGGNVILGNKGEAFFQLQFRAISQKIVTKLSEEHQPKLQIRTITLL